MTIPILPNPPTDNLYKYCALVGTIILILSLYFPSRLLYEMGEKSDAIGFKIEVTKLEAEYYRAKADWFTTLSTIRLHIKKDSCTMIRTSFPSIIRKMR